MKPTLTNISIGNKSKSSSRNKKSSRGSNSSSNSSAATKKSRLQNVYSPGFLQSEYLRQLHQNSHASSRQEHSDDESPLSDFESSDDDDTVAHSHHFNGSNPLCTTSQAPFVFRLPQNQNQSAQPLMNTADISGNSDSLVSKQELSSFGEQSKEISLRSEDELIAHVQETHSSQEEADSGNSDAAPACDMKDAEEEFETVGPKRLEEQIRRRYSTTGTILGADNTINNPNGDELLFW